MRHVGRADHFRAASWFERAAARLRRGRRRQVPLALRRLHELVLELLPGDHLVARLPRGERVRLAARYRHLSWNPEEYEAFRAAVRPGATVFDIGANVGAYTLLFAQWVGSAGRVVAFEPAPASAAGLRDQLRLNGVADRVQVVEYAVSDVVGTSRFEADHANGANALVPDGYRGDHAVSVRTTSLDAFCEANCLRPDVIKIDVEGAELDVLRGARRTLAAGDIAAFMELHPAVWPSRGVTRESIRTELAQQGFAPEPIEASLDIWNTEGIAVRLRRM